MADAMKDIISRLEGQRAAIERALAALREVGESGAADTAARSSGPVKARRKRGRFTAEARKRMSEAQKRRWALKAAGEQPAAKKSTAKTRAKRKSAAAASPA